MNSEPSPGPENLSWLGRILKKNPDLLTRAWSALLLAPAVLAVTWYGGLLFALVVLLGSLVLFWEWGIVTQQKKSGPLSLLGFALLVGIGAVYIFAGTLAALAAVVVSATLLFIAEKLTIGTRWFAAGLVYSSLACISIVALREGSHGLAIFLYLLFLVWASDVAAYFCGRTFGGPKLWPAVSPNKTWSGAIGGVIFAALAGALVAYAMGAEHLLWLFALAALLSAASQLGDLFESSLKRRFNVKDASQLIPGHGGLMDRVDGLVFAAFVALVIGVIFGGSFADPGLGLMSVRAS
ncbi:phosphatidate cytidylyltransferase [Rhodobacteraceae bacterium RKSG542]|uniref:phosphatidate cytidylyltransferase n=1 Tax=Pseudovibrio flavus TaxID=2529854 RepID=UPI0012BBAA5D|nr:phosphatidate cytidylyltransferase [Pseudovibrio flavus]MTI16665.1 phosphatidate cytidylyltransferase [Pseudovibrio flavus]